MRFTCCRCSSASNRAAAEETAPLDWRLAPVWQQARAELAKHTRKPDQEWVRMLRLLETHPAATVERAVRAPSSAIRRAWKTVRLILRRGRPAAGVPAGHRDASAVGADRVVPAPTLSAYDALVEGIR